MAGELLVSVVRELRGVASTLRVRSALNPLILLTLVGTPILFFAAFEFAKSEVLRPFCPLLIYTGLAIPAATLVVGIFFAVWKPDKLQSEEFQIKQQALLMLQMGRPPRTFDSSTSIVAIANPALEQEDRTNAKEGND